MTQTNFHQQFWANYCCKGIICWSFSFCRTAHKWSAGTFYAQTRPSSCPELVGRPTRWSLLFLFWPSSWCLRPHIGVSFSVWPLLRAGMVVLDQFFSKMYFLYIWRSPPKNLTEFWGVLAPQNKVYFRALSVSQKMWMSRPHVGKYRWILYDISYGLIINCNESTMIILSDLMKGTCFQTNACK